MLNTDLHRRAPIKSIFCIAVLLLCTSALAQSPKPRDGYVPDEKTAIRIAEAVLSPIYGEDKIIHERPFHATLNGDVWIVTGTLEQPKQPGLIRDGGVAEIRIDMHTAAILSYTHGK
jgi:hypothetical protein